MLPWSIQCVQISFLAHMRSFQIDFSSADSLRRQLARSIGQEPASRTPRTVCSSASVARRQLLTCRLHLSAQFFPSAAKRLLRHQRMHPNVSPLPESVESSVLPSNSNDFWVIRMHSRVLSLPWTSEP